MSKLHCLQVVVKFSSAKENSILKWIIAIVIKICSWAQFTVTIHSINCALKTAKYWYQFEGNSTGKLHSNRVGKVGNEIKMDSYCNEIGHKMRVRYQICPKNQFLHCCRFILIFSFIFFLLIFFSFFNHFSHIILPFYPFFSYHFYYFHLYIIISLWFVLFFSFITWFSFF